MSRTIDNPLGPPAAGLTPASPLGHRLMFLLLATLAFGLLAPVVLLPLLREHGELLAEEQRLRQRVAQLEKEAGHQAELIEAFQHDSVINERLAVLDLHYRKPDEEILPVLPSDYMPPEPAAPPESPSRSALRLPDEWPAWARRAETWAQERGLIDLFLDPGLRPVFLLMAGGLFVSAFVLFAPSIRHHRHAARLALGR